ncbi:universal stress protein [Flagellimonas lutaonensis]|uniref:UspA domain-containing protein n=1 Tax=Flagellimonas lutaonensis TaxID=516051 RepID=A0A0D5YVQ2_9FLAO|nr:universal stress protein [Allomuricauda lutaonensis]AKA35933.1 hypothetical protein VC82_2344 [Allomuricauda lutaonensis]
MNTGFNILLPTDFSKNAQHAVRYAVTLFADADCTFYLLNAYEAGPSALTSKMYRARDTRFFRAIKKQAERELDRVFKELTEGSTHPRHQFKKLSVADSLVNAVGRAVVDLNIDYVVMGTKGASGLKEVFMGSNTVKIIKAIDFCPLIAVPQEFPLKRPKEILFATGYEHIYGAFELSPLVKIAQLCQSKVIAMHIRKEEELLEHQKTAKELLSKRLKSISYELREVANGKSLVKHLDDYIGNHEEIGLLTMINYWHSFFEKITHEPVIKKVAFHCKVPFLVIHSVQ